MIDFEIMEWSLKIAWIKRIAESSNASWKKIPNQALNQYGGLEFLIECDYDPNLLNLASFFFQLLSVFSKEQTFPSKLRVLACFKSYEKCVPRA